MINASFNNISFKATPEEINSLKQVCNKLAKNENKNLVQESFDLADINGKVFISREKIANSSRIKFQLLTDDKINSGTTIYTKDKNFFNKKSTLQNFEKLLDILKASVNRAKEKESWTD